MKKLIIFVGVLICSLLSGEVCCANNLRTIFQNNAANIYVLNIRTFSAKDKNGNEIIDIEQGEVPGTFTGAAKRLPSLASSGVNAIHLLPITPVGKLKALGTAGSLYAMDDFATINPQLDDKTNPMSVKEEAKMFVREAHKLGIHVIVDLPSCGSYDMSLRRPELFVRDSYGATVTPADWSDVRLFKTKNANGGLNQELMAEHKRFIDMLLELKVDGVRADVATIKPYEFWSELIAYARAKDPQFLFLAEASPVWKTPAAKEAVFTPYDRLVQAGFDGYLGNFMNYSKFTSASELFSAYKEAKKLGAKFNSNPSIILNFATHDDVSPILVNPVYAIQLAWLSATLPGNTYFVSGFQSGDSYIYNYANKPADKTYTDNENYYVHRGKLDIFNFSRRPGGSMKQIAQEFEVAARAKYSLLSLLNEEPNILQTSSKDVFAYEYKNEAMKLLVILNHNLYAPVSGTVNYKANIKYDELLPLHSPMGKIKLENGKLNFEFLPADIAVFVILNEMKLPSSQK